MGYTQSQQLSVLKVEELEPSASLLPDGVWGQCTECLLEIGLTEWERTDVQIWLVNSLVKTFVSEL